MHAQPCSIKLNVTTAPSTCQANGEIHCTLSDTAGSILEQIRYTYIPQVGLDSITHTELPDITQLRPGKYSVIVSALCATQQAQSEAFTIISDTITNIVIGQEYDVPRCGIPYNIFSFSAPYGIVPAFECTHNGKVQINIEDGIFPYVIDIWKIHGADTIFYKTATFDQHQHDGINPLKYDYFNYYTIDSLEIGDYYFLCHDGCGYYMPALSATVPRIKHSHLSQRDLLRNSSGDLYSNNIITFKKIFSNIPGDGSNDDYYRYSNQWEQHYEYRFINPNTRGAQDTTPWRLIPTSPSSEIMLYDTVSAAADYSQLWYQNITLQTRLVPCSDTIISSKFKIYPQYDNSDFTSLKTLYNHSIPSYYDSCGYHSGLTERDYGILNISFLHSNLQCTNIGDSVNCHEYFGYTTAGTLNTSSLGVKYHNYITFPLRYKVTNLSADTVITFSETDALKYQWVFSWKGDPQWDGDSVVIEIFDANYNPLYATARYYDYYGFSQRTPDYFHPVKWISLLEETSQHYCPDSEHSISLYQAYGSPTATWSSNSDMYTYFGDTIRIIESPHGNAYNFIATSNIPETWNYTKEHSETAFDISFGTYEEPGSHSIRPTIKLTATGLPNGRYVWVVSYPCEMKNDTIVQDINYLHIPDTAVKPTFLFEPQCSRLEIIPVAGSFAYNGTNLDTYFDIRSEGILNHSINAIQLGDTLSAGILGNYTLSMYALPDENPELLSQNPCYVWDSIIVWDGNRFALDYLYAYVCDAHDETGFVRVRSKHGVEPYTYKLYDAPDGSGNVIATNNDGDFWDIPCHLGQGMSLELTDDCASHFITNFTINNLKEIRKGWAEDNQHDLHMYIGDTCHFYGISLGEVEYVWTGPNGFEAHTQNTILPITDELQSGRYYVAIYGSGCDIIQDSLTLFVRGVPCPDAIDFEGSHYTAVRIDNLCWTQRNLESRFYADGRAIQDTYGYISYEFPDKAENIRIFGRLYNWHQATDSAHTVIVDDIGHIRGICPEGWYLPDRSQYEMLSTHGAYALRSADYWINESSGNNSTGFAALPAGFYNGSTERYENLLGETRFWSSSPEIYSENTNSEQSIFSCESLLHRHSEKENAYSIRCILAE
ncbi:MAG: fibrobacter succinogenes major paralogous domain-containing protein [Bacteroidales bacterium]|nr:fibrobacter succinogenes major paralogous domain-containing protein [Bacteroidales bacterium]